MENMLDEPSVRLIMQDSVRETLEHRGISESYVGQVISYAQSTSNKLMNTQTGHLIAHLRIGSITCWAEYMPQGDGYRVMNAYMHRIAIEEGRDGGGEREQPHMP